VTTLRICGGGRDNGIVAVKEMEASEDNECTDACLELERALVPSFECFELDDYIDNCGLLGNVAGRIGARDLIAVQLRQASECLGCLESHSRI
jgi:hypothetical protein